MMASKITITATVHADLDKTWNCWTDPEHIVNWNFASDDWHCPKASNDPRTGGKFSATMAAKDGSMSFDFEGIYEEVVPHKKIVYTMSDGRQAIVEFEYRDGSTYITESFDPESMNSRELQQAGWQAILDNFKKYTEQ